MSFTDLFTGGLVGELIDLGKSYFPPDLSPEQKQQYELDMQKIMATKAIEAAKIEAQMDQEFNSRLKEMEGTASDLKTIPFLGPMMIFMRGCQRPIWGFATLYMDFYTFSGKWVLDDQDKSALWVINLLVLGFLFGERAIKNVMPLINQRIGVKNDKT